MLTKQAPIALFVYNRPEHTQKTLESLSANEMATESHLYVFSDGPKTDSDEEKQKIQAVRKLVTIRQWCAQVTLIESHSNKGLAQSIKTGVSQIVAKEGRVIVLEDDIVTSPFFLIYMNYWLDKHQGNSKIFGVNAYLDQKKKLPGSFLMKRPSSWGWATWQEPWERFMAFDIESQYTKQKQANESFSLFGLSSRAKLLSDLMSKKLEKDVWAVYWSYFSYINNAFFVWPEKSYVSNIGFDGSGTNCDIRDTSQQLDTTSKFSKKQTKIALLLYTFRCSKIGFLARLKLFKYNVS